MKRRYFFLNVTVMKVIVFFVVLVSATSFILQRWQTYRSIPKNYVWNRLDDYLSGHADRDDLLLFDPEWMAGYAKDFGRLREFSVVTKKEVSKNLYPLYASLWVMTLGEKKQLYASLTGGGFSLKESLSFSGLELARFQPRDRTLAYDFMENLGNAAAYVDYGFGNRQYGAWREGSWVFPDNPLIWNRIAVRSVSFRGRTKRAIYFHPLEAGGKTLEFKEVLMGGLMRIYGGIEDSGMKTPPGAPVHFLVTIHGEEVATLEFKDTDRLFSRDIDTQKWRGQIQDVSFEVQTTDQTARHFAFAAWNVKSDESAIPGAVNDGSGGGMAF